VQGKAIVPITTALCSTPAGDLPNQTKPNQMENTGLELVRLDALGA